MRKSQIGLAATLLIVSTFSTLVAAPPQQPPSEWSRVATAGEGFSILMPVKPEEQTDRFPVLENTYLRRMYTAADRPNGLLYMAVMQEFPSSVGVLKPADRLEELMAGFKQGISESLGTSSGSKVEMLLQRELVLKSHPGRQYSLSFGESRGLVRAYDTTARAYVLVVIGGDEKNADVTRFFESFEITTAPAPVPRPVASN